MKVINTGRDFSITDDSLKTFDLLPADVYTVRFSKMRGFYLERHEPMAVKEPKIYGVHEVKVKKVLAAFDTFNRSLGVILSGDKGIGKSLFARLLSIRAIEKQMPLVIVEEYYPGIAAFLEDIQQEIVVLFDEFDKTFAASSNGDHDPQAELLSLFDGISQGKKLFVITCNELRKLNDYLVNRPGRFHYHFRFEYPSPAEVKQYLVDKLSINYHDQIESVIAFSRKVDLNYDCLRAIAFEINLGLSFQDAIKDLNIINVDNEKYDITLYFENSKPIKYRGRHLDLFNPEQNISVNMYTEELSYCISIEFNPTDAVYDAFSAAMKLDREAFVMEYDEEYDKETVAKAKALVPTHVTIVKQKAKGIHYAV